MKEMAKYDGSILEISYISNSKYGQVKAEYLIEDLLNKKYTRHFNRRP